MEARHAERQHAVVPRGGADLVHEEERQGAGDVTKSGKLTITTTGTAKKLCVRLRLTAPAVEGYTDFTFTNKWAVKK